MKISVKVQIPVHDIVKKVILYVHALTKYQIQVAVKNVRLMLSNNLIQISDKRSKTG